MIHKLYKEFSQLEQVEAIALGGSRAGQDYDQNSDYDVYVYLNSPIESFLATIAPIWKLETSFGN